MLRITYSRSAQVIDVVAKRDSRWSLLFRVLTPALVALAPALSSCAEAAKVIPAPAVDEATGSRQAETAVLAGGCFWGVQGVFQHLKGVGEVVSGYAGGSKATAEYHTVGTGLTGHAESVQITFDPRVVSYGRILQVYFSVAHDPTQLNRQGPDTGTQYRSAIFPKDDEQRRIAQQYVEQLDKARVFASPIATKIEPFTGFYAAEDYHQDFATLHPHHPYIAYNDLPKIDNFKRIFPELYQAKPVLVGASHASN
jgi:peptide-methionine (S)-S-oxide reductase